MVEHTPRKATQEVIDLIDNGVKNPIELAFRTNKTIKAVQSIAYRYKRPLEHLPTSKAQIKELEREIKAKLRRERDGKDPEPTSAAKTKDIRVVKDDILKDPAYYVVMTLAYKRVVEHVDKLIAKHEGEEGLAQLRKDLEHAAAITEAKALAETSDLEVLIT